MAKIGIFGGTFSPIHNGHLYIARTAREELDLDEVWWIVAGDPPHKNAEVISRVPRFAMCQLSLAHEPGQVPKDFEMFRSKPCYTYELLEWMKEQFSEHDYYFIMGEDSLNLFEQWVHPKRIARVVSLVVAIRGKKSHLEELQKTAERVQNKFHTKVHLLHTKEVPISSTDLRKRIANQKSISGMVPPEAEEYITSHELYQKLSETSINLPKLMEKLESKLKPGRYRHTIGVMETAANLALRYCMPMEKLRIAGLLHDCAKCFDNKELLARCKKYNLPVSKAEKRSPHLLHAKVGAYLAEHEYGISDPAILQAIRLHTTGAPDMSLTEQIVFVADYIEPNRNRAKRLDEIRHMVYMDLDMGTLMILEDTIAYLKEKGDPLDETTEETYHFYKAKVEQAISDRVQ